jgi:flagellar motor switch protein FliN/FliY
MADDEINSDDFGLGGGDDPVSESDKKIQDAPQHDHRRTSKTDFSKLKMILDVPLKVSVELGRTKMLVNDLLQLGQGSVIELDKIAGEPMEILVNDKLVAMGEVVVVNEKFGVRLTDVVSQFGLSDLDKESNKG